MTNDQNSKQNNKVVQQFGNLNKTYRENKFYLAVKRVFDILFSLVLLAVLSPLMLVTAVLIKTDGGPVFYVQERVGKNGKHFKMFKFRSMVVHADAPEILEQLRSQNEMDGPMFKMEHDPRITKIGKFIRKTSIDELPQLINVLIGNMSVVGPRPPLPSEVEQFNEYQKQKLLVKQGITCYWQCSGRNNILFDEWIELDLKYIYESSLLTDIKIILKTIPAVLSAKGAN
ncbi:MAG: sugar transferase [Acutalibacteraceae bacterium]